MPVLDATAWVRIGAAAFAALALAASAVEMGREDTPPAAPTTPAPAEAPSSDPLAAALEACQPAHADGEASGICERAWAQNRRRFLGLVAGPVPSPTSPAPASQAPAPEAPR